MVCERDKRHILGNLQAINGVRLNREAIIVLAAVLTLVCLSSTGRVFADTPQVRNVVVWDDGGTTRLNVTVYHNGEVPGHFVDLLTVTLTGGANPFQNFTQTGPHTLDPDTSTFNVTPDIGPVSDTPLATVQAHCNLHGWSSQNWTGAVSEYAQVMFVLTLSVTMSLVLLLFKRRSKSMRVLF